MDKFEQERKHYPILKEFAYLDHGTSGMIPQYSCDIMCEYLMNRTAFGLDIYPADATQAAGVALTQMETSARDSITAIMRKMLTG